MVITTGLGRVTPRVRLDMFTPRGMLGKLGKVGMVMPLGKLGGLMPLGSELSRAGMVGNLGRVPGISAEVTWLTEGWMDVAVLRGRRRRKRMQQWDGGESERW